MNKILKQEEKQLQDEFRKTYKKMKIYLAGKHLNKYAYEETLLEIAGMCIEGAKRSVEPQDVFGLDYKRFCDEITENTKRQKIWEIILYQASTLCSSFFFILFGIWLTTFAFSMFGTIYDMHIRMNSLLLCIVVLLLSIGGSFYTQTYAFHRTIKTFTIYMVCYMSIYMLAYTLLNMGSEGEYITYAWMPVLSVAGLLAFALYSGYVYIQRRLWKQK